MPLFAFLQDALEQLYGRDPSLCCVSQLDL